MSFIWVPALALTMLVPGGVLLAVWLERRRRSASLGSGLGRLPSPSHGLRDRVPAVLFVAGFAVLAIALARPQATVAVPRAQGTVILAFDVSGSMAATDVTPSRIGAAKAAAAAFVKRQPASVDIGVIAFSDSGVSVQAPTNDTATVLGAIERLAPQKGTALGTGIAAALTAIARFEAGPVVDYYTNQSPAPGPTLAPAAPGSHTSALVLLISDGENNEPPDPVAAAQRAAQVGIRVDTVGVGTAAGTTLDLDGFRVHTQLDAGTLQQIAQVTGGTYFDAGSAQDLSAAYQQIDPQIVIRPEPTEVTSIFAGAGLGLLLAGALSSLLWRGRLL